MSVVFVVCVLLYFVYVRCNCLRFGALRMHSTSYARVRCRLYFGALRMYVCLIVVWFIPF